MKKICIYLGFLTLIFFLTACQSGSKAEKNSLSDMEIALVISLSGIDDNSYNQSSWQAIQDFAKDNAIPKENIHYIQSNTEDEYVVNLANYADKKPDLIVAPGYYFVEPLKTVAEKYPEQKFVILDGKVDNFNVVSIDFANEEGSFLAGIVAAMKAQENGRDTVAFLGGEETHLIKAFEIGFRYGVATIDENMKVLVEYADDFGNPIKGKRITNDLFNQGAYVIYHAAGDTGNGLIDAAKERVSNGENVWVIGVDKDQYDSGIYANGQSVVLTSMVKNIDIVVYDMVKSVADKTFSGGLITYSLKNNGVGFPAENPNLSSNILSVVEEYKQKIINGDMVIPENEKELKEKLQ